MDISARKRIAWVALACLIIVAALIVVFVFNDSDSAPSERADRGSPQSQAPDRDDPADSDADDEVDEAEDPDDQATDDKGGSSSSGSGSSGSNDPKKDPPAEPDPLDEVKQRSSEVISNESDRIEAALDAIAANMLNDPADFSAIPIAQDEGSDADGAATLRDLFEGAESYEPLGEVNIFTTMDVDVYFTYVLVTVQDGGMRSTRTVGIPLRLIGDTWCLSSLRDTTDNLIFVQHLYL